MAVEASFISNPPAVDRRKPHAPRDFSVTALDGGGLQARWRDQGDPVRGVPISGSGNHEPIVGTWDLRVCPVQLAGTQQDAGFALKVLALSTSIASDPAHRNGQMRTLTVADPTMRDVYALIVGISYDGIVGYPTTPALVTPLNAPVGPLDDITSPSLNLVQVLDIYGNQFVELNPIYTAPLVLGRFFGVQLVAEAGYLGHPEMMSLGNVIHYEGKPAGQIQEGSVILPEDPGVNPIDVFFVSVDRQGKHVDDITTAPSVALASGIRV